MGVGGLNFDGFKKQNKTNATEEESGVVDIDGAPHGVMYGMSAKAGVSPLVLGFSETVELFSREVLGGD